VTLALVLLAIPPILTNTYVAVTQVDRETVDAARGMGMTEGEIVRKVELPLALPLIFGGIRTSSVNVIATSTIAPLAGVTTLGDPIINVSTYGDTGRLAAAIVVAALAVAAEVSLGAIQRAITPRGITIQRQEGSKKMRTPRRLGGATAALLLTGALALSACGSDNNNDKSSSSTSSGGSSAAIQSNSKNGSVNLTIGSKNFTEQKVLGEIYAQGLAAAGYKVKKELNLGDEQTALKALEANQISAYPEYTGTALGSLFKVPSKDIPKDPQAAYDLTKKDFAAKKLTALAPTPFTSSNEVGLTQKKADELGGITKISDLAGKSQQLTLYGSPECRQRDDCLKGLQDVYGLKFKKFVPVAIDLRHQVLDKGQADLSIVFTTDPQNSRDKLVLLKDDKGMFPPYNSSLIVRDDVLAKAGPDLAETAVKVQKGLTGPVMAELNARVDLDKKTPAQVAQEYLKEAGLVQ
jgi:glycine betaine/choline ABC-type transport system substrate-binding protein